VLFLYLGGFVPVFTREIVFGVFGFINFLLIKKKKKKKKSNF
jgi:hypothetical protein